MKVDWQRLNHILIPESATERERFRGSALGRTAMRLFAFHERFSQEGRALATVTALMTLFALEVRRADVYILWAALGALIVASLLWSTALGLRHVDVQVVAPRRVAVGEEMGFTLVATNQGPRPIESLRAWGPFLPWDGVWARARGGVPLLPAGRTERVELTARFRKRGEHHLQSFGMAALVPLGLALGPVRRTETVRFLVVPRVARVVRLTLPRGRKYQPGGVSLASKRGDSRELMGVRPYRPGDPTRDLHARSWARVGVPVVREYLEEYFPRIGVVVDTELRGAPEARLEAALSLAAGIVAVLDGSDALVDVIAAGPRVETLTLGRSLGGLDDALDFLATVEREPTFPRDALLAHLEPHLARLSCVVFVCLHWDAERAALRARLEAAGTSVRCLRLTESPAPGGAPQGTPQGAVTSEEAEGGDVVSTADVLDQKPIALP